MEDLVAPTEEEDLNILDDVDPQATLGLEVEAKVLPYDWGSDIYYRELKMKHLDHRSTEEWPFTY